MAKTYFTTSSEETKKVWEEKLYRDSVKNSFFLPKFGGSDANSIVHIKKELEGKQGDSVKFGLRMRLSGSGVTSGAQLEGNEEKLSTYMESVSLEQYRHAVRDDGALSRQRAFFSIDEESKSALQDWMTEKIDALCFDALGLTAASTVTPSKVFYKTSAGVLASTAATAKAALTLTDSKLTPQMISFIKSWAATGGNRSYVPLRGVKVNGREHYVMLVSPDVFYDLTQDTAFQQAIREAHVRGSENPLFKGMPDAIWDDVLIFKHENCVNASDGGGSTVNWSRCAFLGAQALAFAWGERPKVVQKNFDYENEHGYAISTICGVRAPLFNSLTYGSLGVYCARTNVSGV